MPPCCSIAAAAPAAPGKKGISVMLVPPSRRRQVEEMLGQSPRHGQLGRGAIGRRCPQAGPGAAAGKPHAHRAEFSEDDLAMADRLLQSRDARVIAAAFVKIYRAGLPAPEDLDEEVPFQKREPRDEKSRGHHERGNKDFNHRPREHAPHTPRENAPRPPRDGDMQNGVWFRLNVGRERNADPKWLLPEICRQGELTKKDIGAIRVFEMETLFQVSPEVASNFATLVS